MSSIVKLASNMLAGTRLQTASSISSGLTYIETLRSYLVHELAELHPLLLRDRKDLDRLTYSLIDAIERVRNHLCEYVTAMIGFYDPTLQLERFVGPQMDLAISYSLTHSVNDAHAHFPPVRDSEQTPSYFQPTG